MCHTNRKCLEVRGEMPGDAAEAAGEGQDAVAGKGGLGEAAKDWPMG